MAEYYSDWYAKNRERLLPIRKAYNEKYFSDPAKQELRRQLALKPEQKLKRKLYKHTEAGKAAERRYQANRDPEKVTRNRLKYRYGVTPEAITLLKASQQNACAICPRSIALKHHTDHDHVTGKVRGLLCTQCNMALGLFKDNVDILKSAIAYLCNTSPRQP